ncbi:unnamed protein product [Penicillium viridicatum]
MSLADLKVGGLYVILQARQEPPEPNEFYWGLYLHSDSVGGMAYHVVDTGSGLRPEHEYTGGIFNTPLLTGLFRIADITRPLHPFVDRIIRSYDSSLNCPGRSSNSKFWVLNVLALLIQPTATGWLPVNCHNLPILEQEIRDWGNRMSQGRCIHQRPKPIGSSTICGLPEWKTQRFQMWGETSIDTKTME